MKLPYHYQYASRMQCLTGYSVLASSGNTPRLMMGILELTVLILFCGGHLFYGSLA
jgi:hypothetical protein